MSDKPPEKPNLDLIQMVQQARMMHDADAKPSQVAGVYWIEAKSNTPETKPPTPFSGQWELETSVTEVDAVWAKIKTATEAGELGYKSKVSTSSRNQRNPDARTLAIRTYDRRDEADKSRIRAVLENLGITGDWRYVGDSE